MSYSGVKEFYRPSGLVIPMVTPLIESSEGLVLDTESLNNLIVGHFNGYADALFIAGGCGEMYTMPTSIRVELIEKATRLSRGRTHSLIGVSAESLDDISRFSKVADAAEADGVVINLVYGEGTPEEKISVIESATNLPITAYEIPERQGGKILDPVYGPILKADDQIVGIKVTTPDPNIIGPWLDMRDDRFEVLPGSTQTLRLAIERGSQGWVMGLANVFPEAFSRSVLLDTQGKGRDVSLEGIQILRNVLKGDPEPLKNFMSYKGLIRSPLMFPAR